MPLLPIVERLPRPMLTSIGEAVTAWALQEHELRRVAYLLLGLDPKRGRLAVKTLRAKEAVELIADLMHLAGKTSKRVNLKELGELLEIVETRRNALVHNVWLKPEHGPLLLQSLTGSWPKDETGHRKKRRIDPAGEPVTIEALHDLVNTIRETTNLCRSLHAELEAANDAK